MNTVIWRNIAITLLIACAALGMAMFAYSHPLSIKNAASSTISSLSIIFGLSAVVSSLLKPRKIEPKQVSNDPALAKMIIEKAKADDERILVRQRLLHLLTLASIISGLGFLVAVEADHCSVIAACLSAAFAGLSSAALLSTLWLPRMLTELVKRNSYLERHHADE